MGNGTSHYYLRLDDKARVSHDVQKLYRSMKGLGTDEADLIRTLANLSPAQLVAVRKEFQTKHGKHGDLLKWIEGDTSGDFKRFCLTLARDEAEADAQALYDAMKGIGTKDTQLIEVLCNRSPAHIARVRTIFEQKFGDKGSLADWIADDTSGDYKAALLALIDGPKYYAKRLHQALKGAGTDDQVLIQTLVALRTNQSVGALFEGFNDPLGTAGDLLEDLQDMMWAPPIDDVKKAYSIMYSSSLEDDVKADTSGNYQTVLLALVRGAGSTGAAEIHKACAGAGTNESRLIETLVTQSPSDREAIAREYVVNYGKKLEDEISDETSFNFKQTLLSLVRKRETNWAMALREAMKGAGTDEDTLTRILVHRSKKELRNMQAEYERLYQRKLYDDVRSETSGWYRKGLLYLLREANEERVHIPMSLLTRVRDIDR